MRSHRSMTSSQPRRRASRSCSLRTEPPAWRALRSSSSAEVRCCADAALSPRLGELRIGERDTPAPPRRALRIERSVLSASSHAHSASRACATSYKQAARQHAQGGAKATRETGGEEGRRDRVPARHGSYGRSKCVAIVFAQKTGARARGP